MHDIETIKAMNARVAKLEERVDALEKPAEPEAKPLSLLDATMIVSGCAAFTGEEIDDERFIEAAQLLIDTGTAWQLEGSIGRTCAHLIREGMCHE